MSKPKTPTTTTFVSHKPKPADLILEGLDEAYARAAIREASPCEVGGAGRITRYPGKKPEDSWILCHDLVVLKQEVSTASCDFEEAVQEWLLTWNKDEAVFAVEPNLDFLLWHTHPITGWSSQDEQWIANYANAGLLVSIVYNRNNLWESRVDTLVNGIQFTQKGDILIGHPSYKEAEESAVAHVKERVTVEKVLPKKAGSAGTYTFMDNRGRYRSVVSPSQLLADMTAEEDEEDLGFTAIHSVTPKLAAAPVNTWDDRETAFIRLMNSNRPKVYFMESGCVTLHDDDTFLATLNIMGNSVGAQQTRAVFKDMGITKRMVKTYTKSAVLLFKAASGAWATRKL